MDPGAAVKRAEEISEIKSTSRQNGAWLPRLLQLGPIPAAVAYRDWFMIQSRMP